jgi:hypothetical protein
MGDESVISAPVVTYTVNGKANSFSSLDPLQLTMVLIQLDMKIQAGTPTSSGVTFTIDVTTLARSPSAIFRLRTSEKIL